MLFSPNRKQFKNLHLYGAIMIAAILFSPVVIWNAEHQWTGFLFQWGHGTGTAATGFNFKHLGDFLGGQLGVFNPVFFVAMIVFLIKKRRELRHNP